VVYAPAVFWRAVTVLCFLCLSQPLCRAMAAETGVPRGFPTTVQSTPAPGDPRALSEDLASVRRGLDELRASLPRADAAPPWAERTHQQVLQRIERLQEMQERLAARIETPVPRLDEPIVLLTVSGATLVLGFFAGRTVQRRSSRRDRFRL
jgi:hypothetical protein